MSSLATLAAPTYKIYRKLRIMLAALYSNQADWAERVESGNAVKILYANVCYLESDDRLGKIIKLRERIRVLRETLKFIGDYDH